MYYKVELPSKTYTLVFTHTDGRIEYYVHNEYNYAKEHYDLFDDSDADVYTMIEMVEYDWTTKDERMLHRKSLVHHS